MKVIVAFEKNNSSLYSKVIRFWTKSEYSHCELIIDNDWISSGNPAGSGVMVKPLEKLRDNYDYIEVEVHSIYKNKIFNFIRSQENTKYDWLGAFLGGGLDLNIGEKSKWFCSELVVHILRISGTKLFDRPANTYSPQDVYEVIKD